MWALVRYVTALLILLLWPVCVVVAHHWAPELEAWTVVMPITGLLLLKTNETKNGVIPSNRE